MRWTQTLIPTMREEPKDAEAISHKLLLRAGYIRKLSSGIYSYLPLGTRVLQRVCAMIHEEMIRAGADAVLLPALHPVEIWKKSGRYEALGADKLAFKNRTGQEFVLGPTHEEVITDLVGAYVKSYKDLPKTLFQIQTKFRDEIRPRFGIIRTKEFIMKDAYSFDQDEKGLDESYRKMYEAYQRIFTRAGLSFDVVSADPGLMGGRVSQEFMVQCPFGEDIVIRCARCNYLASREIAGRAPRQTDTKVGKGTLEVFDTPNLTTIEDLTTHFRIGPAQLVKTILYMGDGKPIACLVRGDREVNEAKVRRVCGVGSLVQATSSQIEKLTLAPVGFAGPVGLEGIQIVADHDIQEMSDFAAGANKKDKHLRNVNMGRDFTPHLIADIRYTVKGDPCPQCQSPVDERTSMEIGHVFKLGTRYTDAFQVQYLDQKGVKKLVIMGCYGIGVNRILAAHVEEHHDAKGIIWSKAMAPYQAIILNLSPSDEGCKQAAETLYHDLETHKVDTLYDDRDERAGVKFNDADLIGIPLQIVISERNQKLGKYEVVKRHDKTSRLVEKDELSSSLSEMFSQMP